MFPCINPYFRGDIISCQSDLFNIMYLPFFALTDDHHSVVILAYS